MIKRCIELRGDSEVYLLSDDNLTGIIITCQDWDKLKALADIFKSHYEVVNFLSKSKYPTLSTTLYLCDKLIKGSLTTSQIFITISTISTISDRKLVLRSKELKIFCQVHRGFKRKSASIFKMLLKRAPI